jgi:hypothetical protein
MEDDVFMSLDKACISFRIGTPIWLPEARFSEQMALFEKYKGITDEVTFFTSETHPCLPLNVIQERAKLLARRMDQVRKLGYRTGINLLSTIGHHNENLPNSLSGDYTLMTDIEGKTCEGSRCPNGEAMREYIREVYRALATARPDYIWIDDDVRFGHMPIGAACFCETCLAIYARESGKRMTREDLKAAFNTGMMGDKIQNRKSWLTHNRQTIARLFELIEKTVHAIAPAMPLGFMTGDRFFEGYDFDTWADILAGPNRCEVMWRPGGGFYSDEALCQLVGKSHDVGRQVSMLPDSVVSIQSEIENFPYQRLKKAAHTTALESAAHIAAGCTGTAFNVLQMYDEPLDEYEPLLATLHQARPFYDLMVKTLGRAKPQGLFAAWNKDSYAVTSLGASAKWPISDNGAVMVGKTSEIHEIGIPAAYSLQGSQLTALTSDAALALSEAELKTVLSRGTYLDGPALTRLNEMGYADYTGFTVAQYHEMDCIEELLPHDLNRPFVGRHRDNRQSFLWWNVPAAELIPAAANAQPLSRLIDYGGKQVAACSSGVFENKLGGRVCIGGYFPWTYLQNLSKASQLKTVFRWLARDTLLAYIASYHKINLWVREAGQGRLAVALVNTTLDAGQNVELMLRTESTGISIYNMACEKTTVRAAGSDGPYRKFLLPTVPSWSMLFIVG